MTKRRKPRPISRDDILERGLRRGLCIMGIGFLIASAGALIDHNLSETAGLAGAGILVAGGRLTLRAAKASGRRRERRSS